MCVKEIIQIKCKGLQTTYANESAADALVRSFVHCSYLSFGILNEVHFSDTEYHLLPVYDISLWLGLA